MKTWDLAKKSHFAWVLSTEAVNANFLHTMMIYIENGTLGEILKKNVENFFQMTPSTTVKLCPDQNKTKDTKYIQNIKTEILREC